MLGIQLMPVPRKHRIIYNDDMGSYRRSGTPSWHSVVVGPLLNLIKISANTIALIVRPKSCLAGCIVECEDVYIRMAHEVHSKNLDTLVWESLASFACQSEGNHHTKLLSHELRAVMCLRPPKRLVILWVSGHSQEIQAA